MKQKYSIGDEELLARLNAVLEMGGHVALELDGFMRSRAQTTEQMAVGRMRLFDSYFKDASETNQSLHSQASAAFDAGYLAALVLIDAKAGLKGHPREDLLKTASTRMPAGLDWGPVFIFFGRRYDAELSDKFDVPALRACAVVVRETVGRRKQ